MKVEIIDLPKELFEPLLEIAEREQFPECLDILSTYEDGFLRINHEQAQTLVHLLGYEANRLSLKYPYTDEHPNYNEEDAERWSDFCQSIMPHTLGCISRHFDIEE